MQLKHNHSFQVSIAYIIYFFVVFFFVEGIDLLISRIYDLISHP